MKRSYGLPRKLVYKSFPFAMIGMLSCAPSPTASNDGMVSDGAIANDGMASNFDAHACYINDMLIPTVSLPPCVPDGESHMVCPDHACTAADCPPGCLYLPFS
jgi:hypothetical protein